MAENEDRILVPPLFFGRLTRVLSGIATLAIILGLGPVELTWAGFSALLFLGLSLLVGGLMANPGCEISALINLLPPASKRIHFP